jgi:hypothetical protein
MIIEKNIFKTRNCKRAIVLKYRQIGKEIGKVGNVFEDKTVILSLIGNSNRCEWEIVLAGKQWWWRRIPEKETAVRKLGSQRVWMERELRGGERKWMIGFRERREREIHFPFPL